MKRQFKIITKSENFIYYVTREESNTNWYFKIATGVNYGINESFLQN